MYSLSLSRFSFFTKTKRHIKTFHAVVIPYTVFVRQPSPLTGLTRTRADRAGGAPGPPQPGPIASCALLPNFFLPPLLFLPFSGRVCHGVGGKRRKQKWKAVNDQPQRLCYKLWPLPPRASHKQVAVGAC